MLSLSKLIFKADKFTREEWAQSKRLFPLGNDLYHKTLGLIGFGRISYQVAKRARAFDMDILYTDLIRNEQAEKKFNAKHVSLREVMRNSDYVSIHAPLNTQTKGMIGEQELRLMKETAFLINTARGGIVDHKALTKVLKEKRIAGAGLDVFVVEPIEGKDPLMRLDNVILSPHIGSATVETRRRMGMLALDNVLNVFHGRSPEYLVPEQKIEKITRNIAN
jgi:glyoxylate reductase